MTGTTWRHWLTALTVVVLALVMMLPRIAHDSSPDAMRAGAGSSGEPDPDAEPAPPAPQRLLAAGSAASPLEVAPAATTASGLIVTVRDQRGAPVTQLPVAWTVDNDISVHIGWTDQHGVFVEDLPMDRSYVVTVAGQTKAGASIGGPLHLEFVVSPYRRIDVAVVDMNGEPLTDATVQLGSEVDPQVLVDVASTDPAGRASVVSFNRGDMLSVAKPGWRGTDRLPVTAAEPRRQPAAGELTWSLDFVLEPVLAADLVEGRVVDDANRPIAAAVVTWFARDGSRPRRFKGFLTRLPAPVAVRTDAAGRFALPLCRDVGRLSVQCEGYADCWLQLDPDDYEVRGIEVVMTAEKVVRGFVIDQAGQPVPGAEVEVATDDLRPRPTLTDARGRFELRGIAALARAPEDSAAASVRIGAFHPAHGTDTKKVALQEANETPMHLVLSGNLLHGRVHRGSLPVTGARVTVHGTSRRLSGNSWGVVSYSVLSKAPDGAFAILRPDGPWELVVEPEGESLESHVPFRRSGAGLPPTIDIDLHQFERSRGALRMRLVDSDGQPVDSYWLHLLSNERRTADVSVFCSSVDGALEARVPAGAYWVAVTPRSGVQRQETGHITVTAGGQVDLGTVIAESPVVVQGTLTPAHGVITEKLRGVVVLRAKLRAQSPAMHYWVGGYGAWEIGDVAPGEYTIQPGAQSEIDFEPARVVLPLAADEVVRLVGHPCWRGRVMVQLPASASGPWVLQYENCHGSIDQRTFDASSATSGVASLPDVLLRRGVSQVLAGQANGELRRIAVTAKGFSHIWIDLR